MGIANAGGVDTSVSDLQLLQHPSIWSLGHDASCVFTRPTPGALHVEQTADYDSKRHGDGKLCNATRCERIG